MDRSVAIAQCPKGVWGVLEDIRISEKKRSEICGHLFPRHVLVQRTILIIDHGEDRCYIHVLSKGRRQAVNHLPGHLCSTCSCILGLQDSFFGREVHAPPRQSPQKDVLANFAQSWVATLVSRSISLQKQRVVDRQFLLEVGKATVKPLKELFGATSHYTFSM